MFIHIQIASDIDIMSEVDVHIREVWMIRYLINQIDDDVIKTWKYPYQTEWNDGYSFIVLFSRRNIPT